MLRQFNSEDTRSLPLLILMSQTTSTNKDSPTLMTSSQRASLSLSTAKNPLVPWPNSRLFGFDYYANARICSRRRFQSARRREPRGHGQRRRKRAGKSLPAPAIMANRSLCRENFRVRVVIYAPAENVNEAKMQAIRELGAEVRLHGPDFDEARLVAEEAAAAEGSRFIHSANEAKLISGVGTIGLEIFEDLSDVDVIIAAVGGGSCAAGNCLVRTKLNPKVRVIGVQSEQAPAVWHAWKDRVLKPHPRMETEHEGLATRVPFELTNQILWELLDDFVLVSDEEINDAIRLLAQHGKQVAEGAGAASLAAAIKLRDQLQGKKVVGILSGGNIPLARLTAVLSRENNN